jgi:Ca2+-binding RTX toxin-like protein
LDSSLVFTLTRSGDLSAASSVGYTTRDGTATGGSDYSATSGTINFAAGQATATVTIRLIDDTSVENAETLTIELSGGTNVTIADSVGVGTILSEDVAPPAITSNTITGTDFADTLYGTSGRDIIAGRGGDDVINGGGGADWLTGGGGSDRFVFGSASTANGDVITDFYSGFDTLDLRSIDANPNRRGDQSFAWLDTGAFTGKAGQLREYDQDGKHFIAGDINGDRIADFTIEVAGSSNLSSLDILF